MSERDEVRADAEFQAMETYLKQVWFSNGIYHHYGCGKFTPGFTECFFRQALSSISPSLLPLADGETAESLLDILVPIIFNPSLIPSLPRAPRPRAQHCAYSTRCQWLRQAQRPSSRLP